MTFAKRQPDLCHLLCEHEMLSTSESQALLALMLFPRIAAGRSLPMTQATSCSWMIRIEAVGTLN